MQIEAIILQGHRVASGTSSSDRMFNEDGGTIRLQIAAFKERGLDFEDYFGGAVDEAYVCGTLNLTVAPYEVRILKPDYDFKGVRWTHKFDKDGQPPFVENFYLSPAMAIFNGQKYKALIYIPAPETKPGFYHPSTTIEIIAQKIPDIHYGDRIMLEYNPAAIGIN